MDLSRVQVLITRVWSSHVDASPTVDCCPLGHKSICLTRSRFVGKEATLTDDSQHHFRALGSGTDAGISGCVPPRGKSSLHLGTIAVVLRLRVCEVRETIVLVAYYPASQLKKRGHTPLLSNSYTDHSPSSGMEQLFSGPSTMKIIGQYTSICQALAESLRAPISCTSERPSQIDPPDPHWEPHKQYAPSEFPPHSSQA